MRTAMKALGLTAAACAACCALPILGPLLAALGFAGLGTAAAGWAVGLAVLVLAAAVSLTILRRRAAVAACAGPDRAAGGCGCGSMPTSAMSGGKP